MITIKQCNKIGIIGLGGFSREIKAHITSKFKDKNPEILTDLKSNQYKNIYDLDLNDYGLILGVGDPLKRSELYDKIQKYRLISYIHDEHNLLDKESIDIQRGSIICAGAVLTTNINLGICCHINLNSTIGHDVNIGDFFTCSPGVQISGNCNIGDNVLIGTNSSIKEHINISSNVIIGMNSNVTKNITESGIYFGNPIKKFSNII